jgi:hypothetical protein
MHFFKVCGYEQNLFIKILKTFIRYRMLFLKQGDVCCCGILGLQSSSFSCNKHKSMPLNTEDERMSLDETTTGNISCAEIVSCLENIQHDAATVQDNATPSTDTNTQATKNSKSSEVNCQVIIIIFILLSQNKTQHIYIARQI